MVFPRQGSRGRRDVRFLWRVLLVVPPVVILSAVSVYSLRQDRASIEQDARRNATVVSEELARRFGERLRDELAAAASAQIAGTSLPSRAVPGTTGTPSQQEPAPTSGVPGPLCGLILNGRIRLPADYPPLPSPPAWLLAFTDAQAQEWRVVASATPTADLTVVRRAVAALAGAPAPVKANAEWYLARAEAARDARAQASRRLADLAARCPDVLSESGTPLADLALLLALDRLPEDQPASPLARDLWQRMIEHPSFMTPALIEEATRRAPGDATVARLSARWRANELALELLRRLPADDVRPGEIILEDEAGAWIAVMTELAPSQDGTGEAPAAACHVTLIPMSLVDRAFRSAITTMATPAPAYATAGIRLAGRWWRAGESPADTGSRVELASTVGRFDTPLLVPADALATLVPDLLRIAPQSLPPAPVPPAGAAALAAPATAHAFTVGVDLVAPDVLYASYRRRFWLAMGLILAATVAALGGLASTWNAFLRQRRLSEMKSNFVASVSHELRAPIAAVRLMAESLERGTIEREERRQEYLEAIVKECRRLSSLVANVLDFSRMERGRTSYAFEPADVPALVSETVELMQPLAAERNVRLVRATPAAGAPLERRIDREALRQALVNLVDNAIKHSPAGAEVTVGVEGGAEAVDAISLFVEDHGPGIPADEAERIFEPFYRRGSELRRETQGIGIGLSIVKHIAEAHGGRVVVQSSPGAGSRFAIELPPLAEPKP